MIAVIFEVEPKPGRRQRYLDIAASLWPALDRIAAVIRDYGMADRGQAPADSIGAHGG